MKQLYTKYRYLILAISLALSKLALADNIGDVARGMTKTVGNMTQIVQTFCAIVGVGLITGSFITYRAHRNNPEEVSLFKPIFMLLMGIALIIIGFLPMPKFIN